jgi:hypothetical protein
MGRHKTLEKRNAIVEFVKGLAENTSGLIYVYPYSSGARAQPTRKYGRRGTPSYSSRRESRIRPFRRIWIRPFPSREKTEQQEPK